MKCAIWLRLLLSLSPPLAIESFYSISILPLICFVLPFGNFAISPIELFFYSSGSFVFRLFRFLCPSPLFSPLDRFHWNLLRITVVVYCQTKLSSCKRTSPKNCTSFIYWSLISIALYIWHSSYFIERIISLTPILSTTYHFQFPSNYLYTNDEQLDYLFPFNCFHRIANYFKWILNCGGLASVFLPSQYIYWHCSIIIIISVAYRIWKIASCLSRLLFFLTPFVILKSSHLYSQLSPVLFLSCYYCFGYIRFVCCIGATMSEKKDLFISLVRWCVSFIRAFYRFPPPYERARIVRVCVCGRVRKNAYDLLPMLSHWVPPIFTILLF